MKDRFLQDFDCKKIKFYIIDSKDTKPRFPVSAHIINPLVWRNTQLLETLTYHRRDWLMSTPVYNEAGVCRGFNKGTISSLALNMHTTTGYETLGKNRFPGAIL